ncbi:hypothetical protein CsatA_028003 [Cannabis sativa]
MKRSFYIVEVLLLLINTLLGLSDDATWAVNGSPQSLQSCYCKRGNYSGSGEIRPHSVTITEFGAVGDGVTLNTKAFQNAIFYLNSFADKGGAKLFVPAGRWLTGSFDLISHLTVWLDKDAVILGSQRSDDWPLTEPLPSYGRGRELPGRRHRSLIYGRNLTDIIITGDNGTVDGQGSIWWDWFENKTLNYTRPHLVELMNSTGIVISNLTFINSPFWTIHPVYCSQVTIQNVTILAPRESPNTDGIDPDSSDNVCIEDCYISTGDDLVAIKSGWDEYGILYGRPSTNIFIHRLIGESGRGSGIAIGSEMSGGVSQVHAENIQIFNSGTGIGLKTSPGRGGYVRDIYVSNLNLVDVETAIRFNSQFGEHPKESYDPKALPLIERITIKEVVGVNIKYAGILEGLQGDTFANICLSNIHLSITTISETSSWNCSNIQGYSNLVSPKICEPLQERIYPEHHLDCYRLSNHLWSPIRRKGLLSFSIDKLMTQNMPSSVHFPV